MSQKMTAEIPLVLTGQAPALDYKENFLDHQLNEVSVECLPDKLPPHIEVDISGLEEAGQIITAGDLNAPDGVVITTPAEYTVVSVGQAAKAELEVEEEEEEAVVEGEAMEEAVEEAGIEPAGEE